MEAAELLLRQASDDLRKPGRVNGPTRPAPDEKVLTHRPGAPATTRKPGGGNCLAWHLPARPECDLVCRTDGDVHGAWPGEMSHEGGPQRERLPIICDRSLRRR